MSDKLYSSGSTTPKSGQYEVVEPRGGRREGLEVTSIEGNPLPPTPEAGLKYALVDKTNIRANNIILAFNHFPICIGRETIF